MNRYALITTGILIYGCGASTVQQSQADSTSSSIEDAPAPNPPESKVLDATNSEEPQENVTPSAKDSRKELSEGYRGLETYQVYFILRYVANPRSFPGAGPDCRSETGVLLVRFPDTVLFEYRPKIDVLHRKSLFKDGLNSQYVPTDYLSEACNRLKRYLNEYQFVVKCWSVERRGADRIEAVVADAILGRFDYPLTKYEEDGVTVFKGSIGHYKIIFRLNSETRRIESVDVIPFDLIRKPLGKIGFVVVDHSEKIDVPLSEDTFSIDPPSGITAKYIDECARVDH